jgi:CRP/FNR family transcriptional regulator, cyclic AMP receptor protein
MESTQALALLHAHELVAERNANARDWAALLAGFPLFADVRGRRLRKLARSATFAEFASGEIVVGRDDADDSLYIVLEGRAKEIGGSAPRRVSIGDYFGELRLIGERSPYAMVVATQPLYVMRLPRRSVVRLARRHPAFTITLLRDVAGRFMRAERMRVSAALEYSGTGT